MPIQIRLLETDDNLLPELASLMEEMQEHYAVPCPPRSEIIDGLKRRPAGADILIAVETDTVVGFAAYSGIYPGPYLRPGLFLKELYVSGSQRGHGIGGRLMQALAAVARDRGLSRIDWTADPEDPRLLAFYDGVGGTRKPDKLFYRLEGVALTDLAE